MGEWSKRIGEDGEAIVDSLLEMIGWHEPQKNFDIPCAKPGEHARKRDRRSHGIDKLFSYRSPLANRRLVHAVVSVKSSSDPYPTGIKTLRSEFSSHFTDLAQATDCFQRSPTCANVNSSFKGVESAQHLGVLFWISATASTEVVPSIIETLSTHKPDSEINFSSIHVVDNHQASFLFDAISSVRNISDAGTPNFFYPNTGQNYDQSARSSKGEILPVEYLCSPVILMTFESLDGRKTFVIATQENFAEDRMRRLIGLAKDTTQDLHSDTLILFPDYNELSHGNSVRSVKGSFSDRTFIRNVTVATYRGDFRNTPHA